ncbi:hypothetical protein HUJ05_012030 [Dendroctonus ponderosae]|nr:hypothetical protein HUJ05_012030 [Dendroctonus ponderosae]
MPRFNEDKQSSQRSKVYNNASSHKRPFTVSDMPPMLPAKDSTNINLPVNNSLRMVRLEEIQSEEEMVIKESGPGDNTFYSNIDIKPDIRPIRIGKPNLLVSDLMVHPEMEALYAVLKQHEMNFLATAFLFTRMVLYTMAATKRNAGLTSAVPRATLNDEELDGAISRGHYFYVAHNS